MKKIIVVLLFVAVYPAVGQELFVFTEPASNMAKGSIGVRLTSVAMPRTGKDAQLIAVPEVMFGFSKKVMLHVDGIFSNRRGNFSADGAGVYAKYRFYSSDDVQKHFRLAAFGRAAFNNSPIMGEELDVTMFNSGYEGGFTATQLLHKVALSATGSFVKAIDNGSEHHFMSKGHTNAMNYRLSAGKLMLPKHYKNFSQTNLNLMLEVLGQYNTGLKQSFLDIAPSVQLIFASRCRLDVGYRKQLYSGLHRMGSNSFLLRFEYNFFNAF